MLTVATSAVPSPGFWEGTASEPTGGFEYELARELADRFELDRVKIKVVHFHRVVAGHLDGADLALDLLTPTDEREEKLDFSTPYLDSAPTVLVASGTAVPDLASAQELRWGEVRATTLVSDIEEQIAPEEPLRIYDGQKEMLAALESGKVEAALLDLPSAVAVAQESEGRLEAVAQLPEREPLAVALPPGSETCRRSTRRCAHSSRTARSTACCTNGSAPTPPKPNPRSPSCTRPWADLDRCRR